MNREAQIIASMNYEMDKIKEEAASAAASRVADQFWLDPDEVYEIWEGSQ